MLLHDVFDDLPNQRKRSIRLFRRKQHNRNYRVKGEGLRVKKVDELRGSGQRHISDPSPFTLYPRPSLFFLSFFEPPAAALLRGGVSGELRPRFPA